MSLATFYATKTPSHKEILSDFGVYFETPVNPVKNIIMKTCAFITLGCKVNQYETQAIRESLAAKGFMETNPEQAADLYVINTCTVTSVRSEEHTSELQSQSN